MPLNLQVKLIKVLQDMEVYRVGGIKPVKFDVRVIAATNRNLRDMVKEGKFREDLFHRFNEFSINLPPLRERKEDIPLLAQTFIRKYAGIFCKSVKGLDNEALEALLEYNWPGNVTELRIVIERAMLLAGDELIMLRHLQMPGRSK